MSNVQIVADHSAGPWHYRRSIQQRTTHLWGTIPSDLWVKKNGTILSYTSVYQPVDLTWQPAHRYALCRFSSTRSRRVSPAVQSASLEGQTSGRVAAPVAMQRASEAQELWIRRIRSQICSCFFVAAIHYSSLQLVLILIPDIAGYGSIIGSSYRAKPHTATLRRPWRTRMPHSSM